MLVWRVETDHFHVCVSEQKNALVDSSPEQLVVRYRQGRPVVPPFPLLGWEAAAARGPQHSHGPRVL